MRLASAFAALILISFCSAFDLSPMNPSPGDRITLKGQASPGELVSFRSSFSMALPVSGGQYEYETEVEIPQKPNRFTIRAKDVKNFNAGVKLGIWITKGFEANGGVASISHADVPPGRYYLKMFGEALPGAKDVAVSVVAETAVKADSQGHYVMTIDTSGIPTGEYRIEGAGDTKTINLGSSSESVNAGKSVEKGGTEPSYSEGGFSAESTKGLGITSEVVKWYAEKIGMECRNESQYAEAEKLLRKRLAGGYWLVIAKGQPLTEEAGNCEQKYCLVRGIDACRECRQKDMVLKGVQPPANGSLRGNSAASRDVNKTVLPKAAEEKGGFISKFVSIIEWIEGILGIHPGG